jgi:sec-independent protein translocase protein TatA
MGIGPREIIVILLVVLLLFGTRRLGDIGKGLGQGIKNFKKGLADNDAPEEEEAAAAGEDEDEPKQLGGKPLTDKQSARKKQGKV